MCVGMGWYLVIPVCLFGCVSGTPWINLHLRNMGADVALDACVLVRHTGDFDMWHVGEQAVLDFDVCTCDPFPKSSPCLLRSLPKLHSEVFIFSLRVCCLHLQTPSSTRRLPRP